MGLLAGLDALVVALALLFAMLAVSAVIRPLLVNVLSQAPIVGGWLSSHVDDGLRSFQNAITAPANASLYIVSSSLDWVANQGRAFVSGLTDTLGAALWTAWVIVSVSIPAAVSASQSLVWGWVQDARSYAVGLFQTAEHDAIISFSQAEADASTLVSAARSEAIAEVQAAERVVLDEIRKLEQTTGALFLQAENDLQNGVASAEQIGADLVSRAREDLFAAVGSVERELKLVEDQVLAQIPEALRNLNRDLTALGEQVAAQPAEAQRNLDKEIADLKASAPWQLLTNLEAEGENLIGTALSDLVQIERRALSAEIAGAKLLQAKLAPFVRSITAQVRARR